MWIQILLLVIGLATLLGGAEFLIRGASSISKSLGIPAIVIGLAIVAFGTSTPELIVNVFSAISGDTGLAVGTIVGGNIANVFLILGISSLIAELNVKRNTVWREIPFAILSGFIIFLMGFDWFFDQSAGGVISRVDGFILLAFFALFVYYTYELFLKGEDDVGVAEESDVAIYSRNKSLILMVGGFICLFLGGKLLVDQAEVLALNAGLSSALVGLTIVAVGTSLPELATTLVATRKGHHDIAIGTIIGSNIFNIFFVLGLTAVIHPLPIPPETRIDIFVCLLSTIFLFLAMFIGKKFKLERWQGALFLFGYVVYTIYLIYRK